MDKVLFGAACVLHELGHHALWELCHHQSFRAFKTLYEDSTVQQQFVSRLHAPMFIPCKNPMAEGCLVQIAVTDSQGNLDSPNRA
jgi:arginyl-tRNA--protein-N-Asp/Glu arginylyltransferase